MTGYSKPHGKKVTIGWCHSTSTHQNVIAAHLALQRSTAGWMAATRLEMGSSDCNPTAASIDDMHPFPESTTQQMTRHSGWAHICLSLVALLEGIDCGSDGTTYNYTQM
jgi:hypothetical protein